MSSLPTNRPADLRQAILDHSRTLLLQGGLGGLSMRKIARSVGCTPTSIYLHFADKNALLTALVGEGADALTKSLSSAAHTSGDPRTRLATLCRAYLDFGLDNSEYYELMFTVLPEELEAEARRGRAGLEVFAQVLGDAGLSDPFLAANVVWASLHGAVSLYTAQRIDGQIDRGRFVEAAVAHARQAADLNSDFPARDLPHAS